MAAKINQNFQMYKGEVKALIITVKDPQGNLVDLTGKYAKYRVAKKAKASTYLIDFDQTDMQIIGLGQYKINFAHDDTDELQAGSWYHELRIGNSTPEEVVVMTGTFKLDNSITNTVT